MKRSTGIGLILLLLLLAASAYFYFSQSTGTLNENESDFAVADTASITKIFMVDKQERQILLNRTNEGWLVNNDFLARKDVIETLLTTIKKMTVKAPVAKAAKDRVLKNIASDGLKVEIYTNNEAQPNKVFYLGTSDQFHTGSYMLLEGAENPYIMHLENMYGYLNPRFVIYEDDYRRNVLFAHKPEEIQSVEVTYPYKKEQSFEVLRKTENDFIVQHPEKQVPLPNASAAYINQYLTRFEMINFESYERTKSQGYLDSVMLQEPLFTITLTDTADEHISVTGYRKPVKGDFTDLFGDSIDYDLDRLYGHINNEELVIIQYYVFDPITRDLDDFRKKAAEQ